MYGCPGVGLPDFASLQWMARTHSGSSRTSSAARTAEMYPRMVDLACPILTRDAKNSDSVAVTDDYSALDPSKPAKVDNADGYLVRVLGAHPRTPRAATRYEPTAAIAMAQQAAAARNVGPRAWEGTGAWLPATDRESKHQQGHPHPARPQRPQSRQDKWGALELPMSQLLMWDIFSGA